MRWAAAVSCRNGYRFCAGWWSRTTSRRAFVLFEKEIIMARTSWFDDADLPVIDEQVHKLESFTNAMADGVISKQELERQQDSLTAAMKAVETGLNDEQHAKVTKLLVELSAYNIMRLLHELYARKLDGITGSRSS